MTDILKALIVFLKADSDVTALAGERVYGNEIPPEEFEQRQPHKLALIVQSGGIERNRFLPIAEPRFDVWSFGETYYEAGKLDRAIYDALKALDRKTADNVLLHGIALSGGPFQVRDDRTNWPAKWRSITVSADERIIV